MQLLSLLVESVCATVVMGEESFVSYVVAGPGEDLVCRNDRLNEKISALPPEGVLVKVHIAGVCHSDVHQWRGGFQLSETEDLPFSAPSVVPGHEVSGTVMALGSALSSAKCDLQEGDRVAVFPWVGCGQCKPCEAEEDIFCLGDPEERRVFGINVDGGYSEYATVVDHRYVAKIPPSVSFEVGATLGCSCLTAYNALKAALPTVEKAARLAPSVAVGVLGTGGLGQWALTLARQVFAGNNVTLVAIDVRKEKLEYVLQQKLVDKILQLDPSKPIEETIEEAETLIGGEFHVVMDFVNNPATFGLAQGVLCNGGGLVTVGLFGGTAELQLPLIPLQRLKITGVQTGSLADFREVVKFVQSHSISPPPFTHYKLSEATQALRDVEKGKVAGRGVLKVSE